MNTEQLKTLLDQIKNDVAKEQFPELGNWYRLDPPEESVCWPIVCERYASACIEANNKEIYYAIDNLIAVMHGDGGHYREEHGRLKAINDAQELLFKKWKSPSQVECSISASLKNAADNAKSVHDPFGYFKSIDKESITSKDNHCIL